MNSSGKGNPADRVLLAVALALLTVVFLRTAWLCDDAYITLRTVDNLVNGYGLTWNVGERVQAYTHPLWLFLIAAPYYFTREHFLTTVAVSVIVSVLATAVLAGRVARTLGTGLLAVTLLTFSQAFVDYSSSGLENPLTHLLLALYFAVLFHGAPGARNVLVLALLAALGALNRLDTALLYLPGLIAAWWRARGLRATAALFVGFLPLLAWEAFSIVYYGFPFPNTAYAKLATEIPSSELIRQGWHYLENSWRRDPLTVSTMAAGALAALLRGSGAALASAFGIILYVIYVIRIGGDFMTGRFFTPAFVCGAALIVGWTEAERKRMGAFMRAGLGRLLDSAPRWVWAPAIVVIAWVGLGMPDWPMRGAAPPRKAAQNEAWASPVPTIYADSRTIKGLVGFKDTHGIGNERQFYFSDAGLLRYRRNVELPTSRFVYEGKRYRLQDQPVTRTHGSVGFRGYFAGPKAHIIDYYALADPLLARLPASYTPNWRIGHFARTVPPGYAETEQALHLRPPDFSGMTTLIEGLPWQWPLWRELKRLAAGKASEPDANAAAAFAYDGNQIKDERLAEYYDQLVLITRGPIWARERWATIWRMNTGQYDHLIDQDAYRYPSILRVALDDLRDPEDMDDSWRKREAVSFTQRGIEVALGGTRHTRKLEIAIDGNDRYRMLVSAGGSVVAAQDLGPSGTSRAGMAVYGVAMPECAAAQGYDTIRIFPVEGDRRYSLSSLRLSE